MAKREYVDGAGYISDDSNFCGNEDLSTQYEDLSNNRTANGYYPPVSVPPYKKLKHLETRDGGVKSEPMSDHDILKFLQNRPQLAHWKRAKSKHVELSTVDKSRTVDDDAAGDLIHIDNFKDYPGAWQQSETIENFLRRLAVQDPTTALVGPWLWVGRPTIPYAHSKRKKPEQIDIFTNCGVDMLQSFDLQRGRIEGDNPGKVAATITKKLGPFRDQLASDLLTLAIQMGVTNGKWMLFPDPGDLARIWRIVATATANGTLGPVSKVGTLDPTEPNTLMCVYTYDFSDFGDVRRVLNEIVDLGLCHANGKPIYYKCDAYTYLNISSGNPYKLKASLYSSKDILRNEVKALGNGPVARLNRRSIR